MRAAPKGRNLRGRGARLRNETDGRMIVGRTLRYMERLNAGCFVRTAESRKAVYRCLERFHDLPERERLRFASALEWWIGTVMQGMVFHGSVFLTDSASKLEGLALKMSNDWLEGRKRERAAKARKGGRPHA